MDETEPLFQTDEVFILSERQKHDSYICWQRDTYQCEQLDRVLFVLVDGTKVPCTCKCHNRR